MGNKRKYFDLPKNNRRKKRQTRKKEDNGETNHNNENPTSTNYGDGLTEGMKPWNSPGLAKRFPKKHYAILFGYIGEGIYNLDFS